MNHTDGMCRRADCVSEDFACDDSGSIAALPKPGLGVEIDEERLRHANENPPDWHNPVWRHADGSIAEW